MRSPRWLPLVLFFVFGLAALPGATSAAAPVWSAASDAAGAASHDVKVGYDDAGNATAVWRKSSGGVDSVWASTLAEGSTSFGAATRLTPSSGADSLQVADLAFASDAQGNAVVGWTARQSTGAQHNVFFARRVGAASSWTAPQQLSDGNPATAPAVAFSAAGTATLAWRQTTADSYSQIRVSALEVTTGAVQPVQTIAPLSANAGQPELAFDPQGNGALVWTETGVSYSPPYIGAVALRAATLKTGSTSFTGSRLVFQSSSLTIDDPSVVYDAAGNATLAWGNRSSETGAAAGVWAATRIVGATGWPANAMSMSAAEPDVAASDAGGAVVSWVEPAQGAPADAGEVMAAYRGAGATSFDAAVQLSSVGETGVDPVVAAGRGGVTVVAWAHRQSSGDAARVAVMAPGTGVFEASQTLESTSAKISAIGAAVAADGDAVALWQPAGAQRQARLEGSTVPVEPTEPTPTPTTPPTTPTGPTEPTPTTPTGPTPTTPTEPTPTTPTEPTPTGTTTTAPTAPAPAPSSSTAPTATTPSAGTTPTTSGVTTKTTSVAQVPTATAQSLDADATTELLALPSLRSFKALAAKRFKPAATGEGLIGRGDGLALAATGNVAGTLRVVVTSTPLGGRAKNLKPALSAPISAGTTRLVFTGRLAGKPLPAGRYKLKAVFVDAQGRASNRRELSIAIKR